VKRLIVVVCVASIATLAYGQFEHPDLKSGKKQVSSIVLMPVQAEITKVGMKGPEPMEAESREVEKSLTPVVAEVLRKLGCTVQDTAFTPEAFEKDAELRYNVDDLQKQFDAVLGQMTKKSKDVRKGRFTIGDSVAKLPAGGDSSALLFVRATGQVLTGGKKAFGWLVTGQVWDVVQMQIGVIDAKSGDVLYFAKPIMLKNLAKDPAQTRSGIEKSFKNFVKVNTRKTQDTVKAS
jgi:hypothetical protein